MKKNSTADMLLSLPFITKCPGCRERRLPGEELLCAACRAKWETAKLRSCRYCGKPFCDCTCAGTVLTDGGIIRLVKLTSYKPERRFSVENNLIFLLKKRNISKIVRFLAAELAAAIKRNIPDYASFTVTGTARRAVSVRRYGVDHAQALARAVARELSVPCEKCFCRTPYAAEQKNLGREERIASAQRSTKTVKGLCAAGKRYIIIDDICTSGASLSAAARLLHSAGAAETVGAVIASRQ